VTTFVGRRPSGATAAAVDSPAHPVFTRSHSRGASSKPRIPRSYLALGADAHRAAAPRLSRRRRRVRACAAATTRCYRRAGNHTLRASVRGAARGAPDRGPFPPGCRAARRVPAAAATRGGGGADAAAPATIGAAATGQPQALKRAASTGGTRWRGRGQAAAGGRVGRAPIPAEPHAIEGGGRNQRPRRRA